MQHTVFKVREMSPGIFLLDHTSSDSILFVAHCSGAVGSTSHCLRPLVLYVLYVHFDSMGLLFPQAQTF